MEEVERDIQSLNLLGKWRYTQETSHDIIEAQLTFNKTLFLLIVHELNGGNFTSNMPRVYCSYKILFPIIFKPDNFSQMFLIPHGDSEHIAF